MNPNITTDHPDQPPEYRFNADKPDTPKLDEPNPNDPKPKTPDAPPAATPLETKEALKLGDTRADHAIAANVASGISIEQQVETRAKELLMKKQNGRRLTKGEQNLVDFYNVDRVHRHPSGALQADRLKRAESVTLDLKWLR